MNELSAKIRRSIFDGLTFAFVLFSVLAASTHPDSDNLIQNISLNSLIFAGLMVFGGVLSLALNAGGCRTLGEVIYAPPHRRGRAAVVDPMYQTLWGCQLIVVLLATFVVGVVLTDLNPLRLVEADAISAAFRLFGQLLSPDWSILPKAILKIIESVFIAFMATAFAAPMAFVLSFLAARNVMGQTKSGMLVVTVLRMFFNLTRSVEPILWAIIFSVWVSFGPFPGMLALMIHSISSLSKQYSEIVESVDQGPVEGIESTGAGGLQTIWFALVPQVLLPYVSYTIDRWDINVRMATILGFVGGGGIGTMLMEYQGQSRWPQVGCIILVIAFVVWVMDAFSAHVRSALK